MQDDLVVHLSTSATVGCPHTTTDASETNAYTANQGNEDGTACVDSTRVVISAVVSVSTEVLRPIVIVVVVLGDIVAVAAKQQGPCGHIHAKTHGCAQGEDYKNSAEHIYYNYFIVMN